MNGAVGQRGISTVHWEDDLTLFLDHAAWMAEHLDNPTIEGFVGWLSHQLGANDRETLSQLLMLDHPSRVAAEDAVIGLLNRAATRQADKFAASDRIHRSVDWPRTYVAALGCVAAVYHYSKTQSIPDRHLQGGLVGLAYRWSALLQLGTRSEHITRKTALDGAISAAGRRGIQAIPFDHNHEVRIRRIAPKSAETIVHALALGRHRIIADSDKEGFRSRLKRLAQTLVDRASNVPDYNMLLEVSVRVAIVRAAIASDPQHAVTGDAWRLVGKVKSSSRNRFSPCLLQSGPLLCEVTKGTPRNATAKQYEDRLRLLSDVCGVTRHDRQPDVVVRFWLKGRPEQTVFALGDAKRNATEDGAQYLRKSLDVAILYLLAYAHALRITLPTSDQPDFDVPIRPAFTLFMRQGVQSQLALPLAFATPDKLPSVLALDMTQHFGIERDQEWASATLVAWFECIARQAYGALRNAELRRD